MLFLTGCSVTQKANRFEMKIDASSRGITSDIVGLGFTFYIVLEEEKENPRGKTIKNPSTINLIR